jgi:hybrid cluster-associated redox disulfide protein
MKKIKITRETNMQALLFHKPELAGMLLSSGMGCMGCPMAQMETIEEGCRAHGMNDKEIDELIERLNKEESVNDKKKIKVNKRK